MAANMVNPRNEKLETNRKLAITHLLQEIGSRFLYQTGIFGVGEFICVSEICLKPTPVTMVTKIWKF